MKALVVCAALSVMAPTLAEGEGIISPQSLERIGSFGVLLLIVLWMTRQLSAGQDSNNRAIDALRDSVEQQRRVAEALEQHIREDARAFERLNDTLERIVD